jgi:hypothetical protein
MRNVPGFDGMTTGADNAYAHESKPVQTPRGRRRWLLLIGTVLCCLVLVEVTLRIVGYGADRGPRFQGYVGAGIRLMCYDQNLNDYLDVDLTEPAVRNRFYDEYGVIDMEETYRFTPYGVVTPCDEREMRPGQIRPKKAGTIRLIAIGDSFTYGHGLKPGDPWPRQLETLLNATGVPKTKAGANGKRRPSPSFEVLNCGVGDTDVGSTAQLFLKHLLPLAPDAVIYGWYLNDPVQTRDFAAAHRTLMDRSRKGARHIPDRYVSVGWETVGGLRRCSAIYDLVWATLRDRDLGRRSLAWINGMYGPDNVDGWAESQRLLRQMADACRQRGAVLHVAIWPMLIDVGGDYPLAPAHEAIADACRASGIACVDLRDSLKAHPVDTLIVHSADRHPSKLACRIAAEAIQTHLQKHHPAWFR